MNFKFLINNIEDNNRDNFRKRLMLDNIYKGKILALLVIILESIFILIDIISAFIKIDDRFFFYRYLLMYIIMIIINIILLILINKIKDIDDILPEKLKIIETYSLLYITLMMTWGSVIALMDQRLYGHLMAFMVNMITCSILYIVDNKKILIPYFFSVSTLMIGLPFYQKSQDVLIGHYINVIVFVFISWLASRILYRNYCNDYKSKALFIQSNELLEKEIKENKNINIKLSIANQQLKRMALIDELTGIPNRRSFRNYIEMIFENNEIEDLLFSVIMVDIDYFKEFNDHYGHEEGDNALIAVANHINAVVKNHCEFVGRWGGEEFIYTAFNAGIEYVTQVAETIRQNVLSLNIPHDYSTTSDILSVSIGIACQKVTCEKDIRNTISLADKALYKAKYSGRNCIRNID